MLFVGELRADDNLRPLIEDNIRVGRQLGLDMREQLAGIPDLHLAGRFRAIVARQNEVPVGIINYAMYENRAALGWIHVHSTVDQPQMAMSLMLDYLMPLFIYGLGTVTVSYQGGSMFELEEPLLRHGFQRIERHNMIMPLRVFNAFARVPAGYELQGFSPSQNKTLADICDLALWQTDRRLFPEMDGVAGCQEFVDRVTLFDAVGQFNSDATVLATTNGKVVGYVLATVVGKDTAFIPDIAILDGHRGVGLGKALLTAYLRVNKLQGQRSATLSVTADNEPALNLYRRVGYQISNTYCGYVWENGLKDSGR
jgi:ribosomal protein S18 acetylase RimI-like enzyme